jgi:hypothetical protein
MQPTRVIPWLFPLILAACSSDGGSDDGSGDSPGSGGAGASGGDSGAGGAGASGGDSAMGGGASMGGAGGDGSGGTSAGGSAGTPSGGAGADGGSSSGGTGSADVAGSCDQRTLQNQCTEYPSSVTGDGLSVVIDACATSQGTWQEGQPCPDGYDAACEDYQNGSITISSFYYEGSAGLTEGQCTSSGGTWSNTLPDYAGSCIESDYKCVAFVGEFDTPAIAQDACTNGTYSTDPCPETDVYGTCTSTRVEYFYNGHPQESQLQMSCEFYGTWQAGG